MVTGSVHPQASGSPDNDRRACDFRYRGGLGHHTSTEAPMPRTVLAPEEAVALREWAERERDTSPELAAVLEDLAANGLPGEDECVPWETVRDAQYQRLGIDPSRWHVA